MDAVTISVGVGLYDEDDNRLGSARIAADVIVGRQVMCNIRFIELPPEIYHMPPDRRLQSYFESALEGVAFIAAANPERIGKDC